MTCEHPESIDLLLVEDSPADVFLVQEALRQEHLRVNLQLAEDGESAIQIIDSWGQNQEVHPPHVILLDINVPRKSGTEILARIRQNRLCRGTPVLMISSSDSAVERQHVLDLGATEYFRKPSTLAEFMQLGKVVRRLHENAPARMLSTQSGTAARAAGYSLCPKNLPQ